MLKFRFGQNWKDYSDTSLSDTSLGDAEKSITRLFGLSQADGLSWLDIGCGSGIFSIAASRMGCRKVVGIDIDPQCVETSNKNYQRFGSDKKTPHFLLLDILDKKNLTALNRFDLVYAWGSLHHTGRMREAIQNACGCVKPGGLMAIAVYNRHWSSLYWCGIKYSYNKAPAWIKSVMVFCFAFVIVIAKWLVTFKNPFKKDRGMNFYHDVVDWIGGYPYEYASKSEIEQWMKTNGFTLKRFFAAEVPTGNNEYLFQKKAA